MAGKLLNLKFKNVVSDDSSCDDEADDFGIPLDKLNLGPRKKLLVLSLGFLVHRVHKCNMDGIQKHRRPDVVYGPFSVFKRPFCDEFMKFCFERFEVGIWSSALPWNINGVLSSMKGDLRSKLVFVLDQEKCTDSGFGTLENKEKPIFLKEVKKLWENKSLTLPSRIGQYSSSNTLLIDDDPWTALLNPPNTAIFPQPYRVGDIKDTFLGPKGELQLYLDGVADADDVPTYVKEHPLGQPAITPSHSDWDYYSKIVSVFRTDTTVAAEKNMSPKSE